MDLRQAVLLAAALGLVVLLAGTQSPGGGRLVAHLAQHQAAGIQLLQQPPPVPPPPPQQQCQLDVAASPWVHHCQRLQRVCLDQSTIILYDDQYQELDGRGAGPLPELLVSTNKVFAWPWRGRQAVASPSGGAKAPAAPAVGAEAGGQQQERRRAYQVQADYRRHQQPPRLRPATSQEPAAYLQDPIFSTCTVPVVFAATWRRNMVHVFENSAVWFAMARRTSWRQHLKPVVLTPDGLGLSPNEARLLPALGPLSLQSLADLSSRLPPGHGPGSVLGKQQSDSPSSFEGGEQRCFQDLLFCGQRIGIAQSAVPMNSTLEKGVPRELFAWGQELVRHVQQQAKQQQPAAQQEAWQQQAKQQQPATQQQKKQQQQAGQQAEKQQQEAQTQPAERVQQQQAEQQQGRQPSQAPDLQASGGSNGSSGSNTSTGGRRLKVVFIKREGEERQLLNAEVLLERCNSWRYRPPGGGALVTADCRQVSTPDLASGVAAAQEADVLVGIHGANMGNSWMMRPGSSTIEVMPFRWIEQPGSFTLSSFNAHDPTSELLWWVLVTCDPALSTPGPLEAQGKGDRKWWARDRSVHLPWPAVEAVLAQVLVAGGDRQRYLEEYYITKQYRFSVGARGVLPQGGPERAVCPKLG